MYTTRKPSARLSLRRARLLAGGALFCCLLLGALLVRGSDWPLLSLSVPALLPAEAPAPTPPPTALPLVDVDEGVNREILIEIVENPSLPPAMDLSGAEPKVLIYHTHNTEAYEQTEDSTYEESGEWRTYENDKNIVAVGALLAKMLREEYGFSVIHDKSDHEPPKLSTAYSRSLETMERYKREYPSLVMFIDVHRDAGGENTAVTIDGKPTARLMFVVGTGEGATGTGFGEMPDFESNYALASAISGHISAEHPGLMRNIRVKTGRYNQHVSSQCLLVEVGDNMNTLEEALNAIPHLAEAIAACAQEGVEAMARPTIAPNRLWTP